LKGLRHNLLERGVQGDIQTIVDFVVLLRTQHAGSLEASGCAHVRDKPLVLRGSKR
jgi:hypothetical protein